CAATFFGFFIGSRHFILNVLRLLLILGTPLGHARHRLANGGAKLASVDWHVHLYSDLTLQRTLRARRLPERIVAAKDLQIGIVILVGQRQSRLFGTNAR